MTATGTGTVKTAAPASAAPLLPISTPRCGG